MGHLPQPPLESGFWNNALSLVLEDGISQGAACLAFLPLVNIPRF